MREKQARQVEADDARPLGSAAWPSSARAEAIDWVEALRADDARQARALERLRSRLLETLPRAMLRFGRLPDAILEDVVQETLLRALDRLDDFEGRSAFTTWVTTIGVRLAMTELRRRRWKDVSLEALAGPVDSVSIELGPVGGDAERAIDRARVGERLREAIECALTERQRTAIVAELHGMPQEEIGRRLGIGRNAVYKLGHDARKKLKRALSATGLSPEEILAAYGQE